MSAIDRLRDSIAIHSGAEVVGYPRAELVAVLQEIDDLMAAAKLVGDDRDKWYQRAKELGHYGRHIGAEIEDDDDPFKPSAFEPLLLKGDRGIELTPAQLVQIIREAGKP